MTARLIAMLTTAAVLFMDQGTAAGQTLSSLRSQVREPRPVVVEDVEPADPPAGNSESRKRKRRRARCDLDDSPSIDATLPATVFLMGVSSPFWLPRAALQDEGDCGYFADYPYDGEMASLTYDETQPGTKDWTLIFQSDVGINFNGLTQTHARLIADGSWRVALDTEFYHRYERLDVGSDELWTGDVNLMYRFAQNENWQFRAGLGMNWLADRYGSDQGFNSTYTIDWFPEDPWMYSGSLDLGTLGDATLVHLRNTIGVTREGWGIFTGHDYFRIGHVSTSTWINGIEFRY